MPPPIAARLPVPRRLHGDTTVDDYAWLRQRGDPAVLAYLEAENEHTRLATAHLAGLRERIFEEIRARVQETDLSAPARRGPWWYLTRTEEGLQYPIHARRRGSPDGPEQIMLDLNALAEGHDFLALGVLSVANGHRLVAYSTDTSGSERFTLRLRDLERDEDLPDEIGGTYYTSAWSADDGHLFYVTVDEAHRPFRLWRHRVGSHAGEDALVYQEDDARFYLSVSHTQDRAFVLVTLESRTTTEVRYLDARDPEADPRPLLVRRPGIEYSVEHKNGRFLIVTNEDAPNGRLVSAPVDDPTSQEEILAHHADQKVSGVLPLAGHVVVFGRRQGLTAVTVIEDGGEPAPIAFDEPVHTVAPGRNLEYDTGVLRLTYQSLVIPPRVVDVDLATGDRSIVKETPVLGGYDPDEYVGLREWATAADGTRVPISIVHRRGLERPAPLLLYGYGAYEVPMDPWFSHARLSLLERGVAFAVAHPRGGGEMGRLWYEDGRLARKENTFDDFAACADHLIAGGFTTPDMLAARGGSAGGLLMGAVLNRRPDLFCAMVAEVPFVDVVNTMLDDSLPLTVVEKEEWGDPNVPAEYGWIRAYAPYENVARHDYPALLVTAGLNDPRVSYWEPAKWVARLRTVWPEGDRPLLLKTDLGTGHMGPSGRYDAWRDEAFVLAWLLDRWGPADASA